MKIHTRNILLTLHSKVLGVITKSKISVKIKKT